MQREALRKNTKLGAPPRTRSELCARTLPARISYLTAPEHPRGLGEDGRRFLQKSGAAVDPPPVGSERPLSGMLVEPADGETSMLPEQLAVRNTPDIP